MDLEGRVRNLAPPSSIGRVCELAMLAGHFCEEQVFLQFFFVEIDLVSKVSQVVPFF